jgi:preprotein translocase subunit SecG
MLLWLLVDTYVGNIMHAFIVIYNYVITVIKLLTYSLMELSPSGGAAFSAATQEFLSIYGTRRFITVFTRALHWSLS